MATIRFTEQFWSDFDQIIDRLERIGGGVLARKYDANIQASVDQLGTHPGLGAPRSKYGRNIRMLVFEPYLIFYEGGP